MNWATFQNPYDIQKKTTIIITPLYTANNQRSLVTSTPRFSSIPSIQDTDSLLHQVRLQENPIFWSSPVFVAPFEIPRNPTRHCSPSHIPQLQKSSCWVSKCCGNRVDFPSTLWPASLPWFFRGPGPTGAIFCRDMSWKNFDIHRNWQNGKLASQNKPIVLKNTISTAACFVQHTSNQ